MPKKTLSLAESLSIRSANLRRKAQSHRVLHWIGGRAVATIAIGAALSVGGVTEALQGVHFLALKDLDASKIAGHQGLRARVVAKAGDGSASNSFFTRPANLPKGGVLQRVDLLNEAWLLPETPPQAIAEIPATDVFHAEMLRINTAIRRQFFANAVPFGEIIHAKAQKYDVDPALVAAVVETESCFRSHARSQVGARGLMQLMPKTGRWMGATNLYNAEQNVDAGAKYLRYLNHRFDGNLAMTIAAYNAGEGNVRRYNGVPPFRETRSYVKRVMTRYEKRKRELKQFDAQHSASVVADEGAMTLR
jgi:Soluble lytic murein transglycosylase and related regulatory proteins (some contain LysM/invasin domains)